MAVFTPGKRVTTQEPFVTVEKLEPGDHVFELVVVDDEGNESAPDRTVVRVVRRSQPR
jgi:hypothetical protein